MAEVDNEQREGQISALRRLGKLRSATIRQSRGIEDGGGRKAIIILFVLTIGLSLVFWLQGNFVSWIQGLFGPSTWSYSR